MRKAALSVTDQKRRNIAYLRVSTLEQDLEKNKADVLNFANDHDFGKVDFVEEIVSGSKPWRQRKIKEVIDQLGDGDRLILPELSRLGRSILEIMEIMAIATNKGIEIHDLKNGWSLNGSLESKVMAFVLGIAAEVERSLIRKRTCEGLRQARRRGAVLGRPRGVGKSKLDIYTEEIVALLKNGSTQAHVARKYGVSQPTVVNWLKKNRLRDGIKPDYMK